MHLVALFPCRAHERIRSSADSFARANKRPQLERNDGPMPRSKAMRKYAAWTHRKKYVPSVISVIASSSLRLHAGRNATITTFRRMQRHVLPVSRLISLRA